MTNINHRLRKHQEWQISKNLHLGISLCLIRLIRKDPDAGKDWRQENKAARETEIVGWHHQLNGHEFELQEMVKDREAWHAQSMVSQRVRHDWATELTDWLMSTYFFLLTTLYNPYCLQEGIKKWKNEQMDFRKGC